MGKRERRALALCLLLSLSLAGLAGLAGEASAILTSVPLAQTDLTSDLTSDFTSPGAGTFALLGLGLAGLALHPSLSRSKGRQTRHFAPPAFEVRGSTYLVDEITPSPASKNSRTSPAMLRCALES